LSFFVVLGQQIGSQVENKSMDQAGGGIAMSVEFRN
jgi:hypothetical protein